MEAFIRWAPCRGQCKGKKKPPGVPGGLSKIGAFVSYALVSPPPVRCENQKYAKKKRTLRMAGTVARRVEGKPCAGSLWYLADRRVPTALPPGNGIP
jgi:hypothetical protein